MPICALRSCAFKRVLRLWNMCCGSLWTCHVGTLQIIECFLNVSSTLPPPPTESGWHRWHDQGRLLSCSLRDGTCSVFVGTVSVTRWIKRVESEVVSFCFLWENWSNLRQSYSRCACRLFFQRWLRLIGLVVAEHIQSQNQTMTGVYLAHMDPVVFQIFEFYLELSWTINFLFI